MPVEVSLSSQGHLSFSNIKQVLELAGCRDVSLKVRELDEPGTEMTIATYAFKDPEHRRRSREMRVHHFTGPDSEVDAHITGDEYTYCVMGAYDGGPTVMRALAEAFGGRFQNDDGDVEEMFETPGAPKP